MPAHVLLRIEAYRGLVGPSPNILEMLDRLGREAIEFEPPRLGSGLFRAADLS